MAQFKLCGRFQQHPGAYRGQSLDAREHPLGAPLHRERPENLFSTMLLT
jgi:hypothetical protein